MTTEDTGAREEVREEGAPDVPCAACGHDGHRHRLREFELSGTTVRDTFCEDCDAPCEYVPRPDA